MKSITSSEIEFTLDDDDINAGITSQLQDQKFEDPIAKALKKIGHYHKVYVGWASATGYKGPIRHDYQIVNYLEVRDFLMLYDSGKEISPITIKLFFEGETRTGGFAVKTRPPKKYEHAYLGSDGKVVP